MPTATVIKWGNSQGIRLSKPMLDDLGVRVGDELSVRAGSGSIVLTPVRQLVVPVDIETLFEGYSGAFISREDGFSRSAGREAM